MEKYKHFMRLKLKPDNLNAALELAPGVIADIIFTKNYYNRNKDLKEFTLKVLNKDYKDYLYKSRTLLYARIVKDLYREEDTDLLLESLYNIQNFISNEKDVNIEDVKQSTNIKVSHKKSNHQKVINEWRSIINPKGSNNDA